MLFNSYIFIFVFLPITLVGFFLLSNNRNTTLAKYWLTAASLLFYTYGAGVSIWLLLASTVVNFILALAIHSAKQSLRSFWLTIGVLINIGLLAYFKYDFAHLFASNPLTDPALSPTKIILPLAISYFTFHQIAYLVDVRIERVAPEKNFLNYALFVSFFPHLIAGPIVYYRDIMPQLYKRETYQINIANIKTGTYLFALGLVKKTLLADTFSSWVDTGFSHSSQLNSLETLAVAYLFALQLYFDFSAYSDMALGLARLFNINFPVNFNSPYKATSIVQFWQQWNITLTNFINSYVYTPLVRLKKTFSFSYSLFATFIAMTMIGIWHGGSWNYVLFGMLHGLALVINNLWKKTHIKLNKYISQFMALNFLIFSLIIFRATNIGQAADIFHRLAIWNSTWNNDWILHKENFVIDSSAFYWLLIPSATKDIFTTLLITTSLVIGYLICLSCDNAIQITERSSSDKYFWIKLGATFTLGLLMLTESSPFFYFQF